MQQYLRCPRQFHLSRDLGMSAGASPVMIYGSAMHAAIAEYAAAAERTAAGGPEAPGVALLTAAFDAELEARGGEVGLDSAAVVPAGSSTRSQKPTRRAPASGSGTSKRRSTSHGCHAPPRALARSWKERSPASP